MRSFPRLRATTIFFAISFEASSMTALAQSGHVATPPCGDARVSLAGRLAERWTEPVTRACEALTRMTDADPTAHVSMRPLNDDLVLEVRLADGRFTTRRLHVVSTLEPTLEALVALPVTPSAPRAIDLAEPPNLASKSPPPEFAVELGAGLGTRMDQPGPYLAASVLAFVQVRGGHWLFGTEMRWDALERVHAAAPIGFETETLALSLTVARRVDAPFGHVDLGVAPRLVSQAQSAMPTTGEETDTEVDVRPAVFTRASFGHGALRFLVELDADVSPTRVRRDLRALSDFPALPSWSAGVSAGAQWETP